MILTAIHDLKRWEVLGPADLNAILGVEQLKDAMGCDDVSCAAELGGALGAPFLVAGQLGRLDDQAVLSLRLMDTQAPAVLERSSARGPTDAESLAKMMAVAVGALVHAQVSSGTATVAQPVPAQNYDEYLAVMNELGRRMSNQEYTEMLADLDRIEKRKIRVPPNTDLAEYLTYYRVAACTMLRRNDCVTRTGKAYLARWPRGLYASAVEGYLADIENQDFKAEATRDEVAAKLEELRAAVAAGTVSEVDGAQAAAGILMGATRYREAADLLVKILMKHEEEPEAAMNLVAMAAMALEQAGEIEKARKLLRRVRDRHPKLFRLRGLDAQLRRLPR
jgi:tetratricopeptide (TPR) repeat protein